MFVAGSCAVQLIERNFVPFVRRLCVVSFFFFVLFVIISFGQKRSKFGFQPKFRGFIQRELCSVQFRQFVKPRTQYMQASRAQHINV